MDNPMRNRLIIEKEGKQIEVNINSYTNNTEILRKKYKIFYTRQTHYDNIYIDKYLTSMEENFKIKQDILIIEKSKDHRLYKYLDINQIKIIRVEVKNIWKDIKDKLNKEYSQILETKEKLSRAGFSFWNKIYKILHEFDLEERNHNSPEFLSEDE